jgi:hypothetical protein
MKVAQTGVQGVAGEEDTRAVMERRRPEEDVEDAEEDDRVASEGVRPTEQRTSKRCRE